MARMLFAAWGTRGDSQASVAVAAALAERGHEIELAGPGFLASEAERLGISFIPLGDDPLAWFDAKSWRRSADQRVVLAALLRLFARQVEQQFEALAEPIGRADLVVGQGLSYAASSLAEAAGLPYRYLSPNVFFFDSRHQPALGVKAERLPSWANQLTWRQFSMSYNLLFRRRLNRRRRALNLGPVPDARGHFFDPTRTVAVFDPELYPVPEDIPFPQPPVGSIAVPPGGVALDPATEAFLDHEGHTVFVDFGSMPDRDPEKTTGVLIDAARRVGARLLISSGWAGLGRVGRCTDVHVIGGLPHSLLFPRVDVVVHHGGVGTAATAGRAGTPQIVVPHAYDQYASGRRLETAGVAPAPLPKKDLDPPALADRLRRVLDDGSIPERARDIGNRISERDSLGAAVRLIESAASNR